MGIIELKNIRVHAHHGCLREESIIGSDYEVDVAVWSNLEKASRTDNLMDTVDYVLINRIVKEEMAIPSKLLEHVSQRIIDRLTHEVPSIEKMEVTVAKINPPIGGDVERVSTKLFFSR